MSDLDELREHKVIGWCDYIDTADGRYVSEDEADVLIAALEARVQVTEAKLIDTAELYERMKQRAEAAEAEVERLTWMLIRNVCDECLVHQGGACSEEEGEDCPPVRDTLDDLTARYEASPKDGDG